MKEGNKELKGKNDEDKSGERKSVCNYCWDLKLWEVLFFERSYSLFFLYVIFG